MKGHQEEDYQQIKDLSDEEKLRMLRLFSMGKSYHWL